MELSNKMSSRWFNTTNSDNNYWTNPWVDPGNSVQTSTSSDYTIRKSYSKEDMIHAIKDVITEEIIEGKELKEDVDLLFIYLRKRLESILENPEKIINQVLLENVVLKEELKELKQDFETRLKLLEERR